jgi:hypothetical protein
MTASSKTTEVKSRGEEISRVAKIVKLIGRSDESWEAAA